MSKSDKKNSKSQPNPPGEEPKIIEIDEGVFGRHSQRLEKQKGRLADLRKAIEIVAAGTLDERDELSEKMMDEGEAESEEEFEKRIKTILEADELTVSVERLKKYLDFLKNNVRVPCPVKLIQEFEWEEYYTIGPGSQKEYEKLKKTRPSYTDKLQIIRFEDKIDSLRSGIVVEVQRLTDKKNFKLNLWRMEALDEKSANAALLKDYGFWFVNYLDI